MFTDQETNIIIMALMYFKNESSVQDVKDLGFDINNRGCGKCQDMVQVLIEDLVGPAWDEEATAEFIKTETKKRTRT